MKNRILNITNGDSAVHVMQAGNIEGDFLPWRDVLHDGPVPAGLSLNALSEVRAKFIVSRGWGSLENIAEDFKTRDRTLRAFRDYDKVVLWFEHDLYDQLQLLQLLDYFAGEDLGNTALSLICTEQYLGMVAPENIKDLSRFEEAVTEAHFHVAQKAWAAFSASHPETWRALLDEDTGRLPFLEGTILRMLEEYPSIKTGLSRTAQHALRIIAEGETKPQHVFERYWETEERRFLGDWSFWAILNEMMDANPALLRLSDGGRIAVPLAPDLSLSATPTASAVLAGEQHFLDLTRIDRWIGGVQLTHDNLWCWDSASKQLRKRKA